MPWLSAGNFDFPPTSSALSEPNGLIAVGGDLCPARILSAYRLGIFPWFDQLQPPLWWTPNPRSVLFPDNLHISKSLGKAIRSGRFTVTADTHFSPVIELCSQPRRGVAGSWITEEMKSAYKQLHQMGFAHSIETWNAGGQLIGGLYGLALGRVFFGESMFSLESNASKTAFAALARHLIHHNYAVIDCQLKTDHLNSLGATDISRARFESILKQHIDSSSPEGKWTECFCWNHENQ